MKKFFTNPLTLILLLAAVLRLTFLSSVPPSLNWDEVSMGYSAYSIAETGRDEWGEVMPIFFRSYGEWKSAFYIYLIVPFVKILGNTALAVRLPSALAGVISVYLTYLIGSMLRDKKLGLWASFLMAISPWALMLGRPGFEANVALTLILTGLYFFLIYLRTENWKLIAASALALGLAPHTYNSAKLVVPLLLVYLVFSTKAYKSLKRLILPTLILIIFAFPLILNLFSGRSQARLAQVGVTTDQENLAQFYALRENPVLPELMGKVLINKASFSLYQVGGNFLSYLSPDFLVVSGGAHNQHSLALHGMLYYAELIFVILGVILLVRTPITKRKELHFLPLIIIGLGIIPAALTRDSGHALRSILTLPGWQLLAAYGITSSGLHAGIKKSLLTLLTVQAVIFTFLYFTWYPHTFARDWQYGHQEVAEYLSEHAQEYDHIVMTKWYGEPQLFLAYYGAWDPIWYQQKNADNLRYEVEGKLWLDQLESYSLGKYTFKYIDWELDRADNTLFVGKFDDFPDDAHILEIINYPDGSIAFVIATQ
jgi:4-amino-4-deoxy-L-arabinose transferase-like glycosyltransferase